MVGWYCISFLPFSSLIIILFFSLSLQLLIIHNNLSYYSHFNTTTNPFFSFLSLSPMRKLCPNFNREYGLDTVLEVPIPEEMFSSNNTKTHAISWQAMKSWVKSNHHDKSSHVSSITSLFGGRNAEIQLLLGVVGAPLIPLPITFDQQPITRNIKDNPIEASMAKYIVQQYVAAVGGEHALNCIDSMYAMGKVKMAASEFCSGEGCLNGKAAVKGKNNGKGGGGGEMGGFVVWQKRPELWCLELMLSGCKISAGSDGKVAWRQTPWHHSHASRGPPRPLRRFLQGLDPKSTATLFSNSTCIGEKTINDEDCFILKLEAESSVLRARSSSSVEIIRHTVWGYFSQRTGLLVQLEDSHLLRIKAAGSRNDNNIFWETTMETLIQDYRTIDGVNIAHAGKTTVSLFRFGETAEGHSKTKMEEIWEIEEVDFNIKGLSMDFFLPPSDLKKEEEGVSVITSNGKFPLTMRCSAGSRIFSSRVAAIDQSDEDESERSNQSDEDEDF